MKDRRGVVEKRTYPRLIMKTDLTFTLVGEKQVYSGYCNNLSHSGIHFSTQNLIPEGASLEIVIDPKNDRFSPLRATVEVVRIDPPADNAFGVAGRIVEYK